MTVTDSADPANTAEFEATVQADGTFSTTEDLSAAGLVDGNITVKADVTDTAGNPASDTETATLDADLSDDQPTIDLNAVGDGNLSASEADAVTLDGTTDNVEAGQTVTLTVTDSADPANTAEFEATVQADGTFSTTEDLSAAGLVDGNITVKADVTDTAGNPASDTETATLDADLSDDQPTIDLNAVGDGNLSASEADAVTLDGTTDNVEAGQTVTLTVTDSADPANTAEFEATVQADGTFSTTEDLSAAGLVDGNITVKADVTDTAGNPASDTETATLDADLSDDQPTIDLNAVGDGNLSASEADAVTLDGTTDNVEAGQTVTLTVTDSADPANTAEFEATVQADGTFSTTEDLSAAGLVDGNITVKADVTDTAGNPASDTETATLDADLSDDQPTIDLNAVGDGNLSASEADAVTLDGTTDNVEAGQTVTLTVTDSADPANTAEFEATVQADGTFSTTEDLSAAGLVDGNITVKADVTDTAGNPASDTETATGCGSK